MSENESNSAELDKTKSEEKTDDSALTLEEKTDDSALTSEEKTDDSALTSEEKTDDSALTLEEKTDDSALALEEKTDDITGENPLLNTVSGSEIQVLNKEQSIKISNLLSHSARELSTLGMEMKVGTISVADISKRLLATAEKLKNENPFKGGKSKRKAYKNKKKNKTKKGGRKSKKNQKNKR